MQHPFRSRRSYRTRIALGFVLTLLLPATGPERISAMAAEASALALPPPVVHAHSTEIVMNSRISYHGEWSGAGTDQMIADILHAAALAPTTGGPCQLYVATPQNLYRYDAAGHSLVLHMAGDQRTDATAAFEIGFAADSYVDAGMAMHLAQLESVAMWTGTSGQLASCPRGTATVTANAHWSPITPLQIVVCFGIRSVPGFTSNLVAISSDGSLPNPVTDGSTYFDDALERLDDDAPFTAQEPTQSEISRLLWASYGCNDHRAVWISGTAGLVCPSGLASYYLTRHIYAITTDGVYRYHCRLPPGTDQTTRDHRIELVRAGDARSALRAAVPSLPEAPFYLALCITSTGQLPELEVGFVAAGAMTEAASIGLHGRTTAGLSGSEQSAIRDATGIPAGDMPMALVSLGHPAVTSVETAPEQAGELKLWIVDQPGAGGQVTIRYALPSNAPVTLAVFDVLGHRVRDIATPAAGKGVHTAVWNCRDDRGRAVASGAYFCRLECAGRTRTARLPVVW